MLCARIVPVVVLYVEYGDEYLQRTKRRKHPPPFVRCRLLADQVQQGKSYKSQEQKGKSQRVQSPKAIAPGRCQPRQPLSVQRAPANKALALTLWITH